MNRRDIIFIAVLSNIAVLAILFMLAFHTDEEQPVNQVERSYQLVEEHPIPSYESLPQNEAIELEPADEVDTVLEEVTPIQGSHALAADEDGIDFNDSDSIPAQPVSGMTSRGNGNSVEIIVKSGDALEKIARANGTTVDVIMLMNNLRSDKLKIGQVLRIPASSPKPQSAKPVAQSDVQFYTMKSGDSLWKIAKQQGMRVDELLKLNELDEERARRLKPGDQIRVRDSSK